MRQILALLVLLCACCPSFAADSFVPKLDAAWNAIDATDVSTRHEGWQISIWRNRENDDLLTIGRNRQKRDLDSYAALDRTMDFASSAHPDWLDSERFPNWREEANYSPVFLKLQSKTKRFPRSTVEKTVVEFTMVNDDEHHPMMANGFVICMDADTFYVQITSKRPVSFALPHQLLNELHFQFSQ